MRGQKPLFAVVLFMIVSFSVFYIVFQAQFSVLQDRIDTLEKQQNTHVTSPNTDEHAHSHAASNQGHDPEAEEEKDYHQGSPKDNTFEDTHNHTMPTITESKNDDEARIKKYQYDVSILDYESVKSEATLNWVDIKWQHPNAQLARLGEREKGYFLDENFMVDYLEKERAKHASLEDMFPYLVVSFTTIPTRIHGIQGVIQSLHQQLLPPDLIVLNLPKVARRFPNMTYDVPDWALKHPKIKINWIDKDLGAGTKLIPTLVLKDVPPNARIMTVDDDAGPGGHMLLQLYLYSLVYPDFGLTFGGWNVTCFLPRDKLGSHTKSRSTESELAAISPSLSTTVQSDNPALRMCPHQNNAPGSHEYYVWVRPAWDYACTEMRFRYGWYHCGGFVDSNTAARVDVMAGYMGVMYQPRFFVPASKTKSAEEMRTAENMPVFNVDAAPNGWAYKIDDVWLSGWLSANNVPKLVINPQKSVIDGVLTRLPWLKEYVNTKQKIWYDNVVVPIQEMWKDWTPPARADGKNVFEIDSLHSLEGFDQQNALLAKWFISEGIWGNEPDRGQILDDWEWEARYRKESGFTRDWMYDPSGNIQSIVRFHYNDEQLFEVLAR